MAKRPPLPSPDCPFCQPEKICSACRERARLYDHYAGFGWSEGQLLPSFTIVSINGVKFPAEGRSDIVHCLAVASGPCTALKLNKSGVDKYEVTLSNGCIYSAALMGLTTDKPDDHTACGFTLVLFATPWSNPHAKNKT